MIQIIESMDGAGNGCGCGDCGKKLPANEAGAHFHIPVLCDETLKLLAPAPGKVIVDGTLGGGGHSEMLLEAGARVIGLDQDPEALERSGKRLKRFGDRFQSVQANFADLNKTLFRLGIEKIDGGLLDIGVSSWQLDMPERGFSFMKEGPLDMRMNPASPVSAADLLNNASEEQLERMFRNFGEEPAARRVAARIAIERKTAPFKTTLELARAIERVIPRRSGTHPATRIFQALRIAVNREFEALEEGLDQFSQALAPGGRFAVITFHSLEDRMVKTFFKQRSAEQIDRPEWPAPRPNPDRMFRAVTRKPVVAEEAERNRNPRSRSAKLRVVERI